MKPALLFDFTVDKENNMINVKRAFAANLELVWDAWTQPEILDQWWAPKPWRAQTKTMNFKEGGYWQYCMIGPENEKHWSRSDYKKIENKKSFTTQNCFCDEKGTPNEDFSHSLWTNTFSEKDNVTTVSVNIKYNKTEDLEKMIAMGFKEGFTMGLQNLDEYLEKQK